MTEVPASHADLLEQPTFAHLATIRPDGSPQSSVMWFAWDGSRIRLTHTSTRQKFANLSREPRVALSIADPDDQYRFLEVRGMVEEIEVGPGGRVLPVTAAPLRHGLPDPRRRRAGDHHHPPRPVRRRPRRDGRGRRGLTSLVTEYRASFDAAISLQQRR